MRTLVTLFWQLVFAGSFAFLFCEAFGDHRELLKGTLIIFTISGGTLYCLTTKH